MIKLDLPSLNCSRASGSEPLAYQRFFGEDYDSLRKVYRINRENLNRR